MNLWGVPCMLIEGRGLHANQGPKGEGPPMSWLLPFCPAWPLEPPATGPDSAKEGALPLGSGQGSPMESLWLRRAAKVSPLPRFGLAWLSPTSLVLGPFLLWPLRPMPSAGRLPCVRLTYSAFMPPSSQNSLVGLEVAWQESGGAAGPDAGVQSQSLARVT